MKEVSCEMAKYLFNANVEVFKLYADGSEAIIDRFDEINEHYGKGGIFGVDEDED